MNYVKKQSAQLDDFRFRKSFSPSLGVNIAADGSNRRYPFESRDYLGRTHVSGMNDVVRSLEQLERIRP